MYKDSATGVKNALARLGEISCVFNTFGRFTVRWKILMLRWEKFSPFTGTSEWKGLQNEQHGETPFLTSLNSKTKILKFKILQQMIIESSQLCSKIVKKRHFISWDYLFKSFWCEVCFCKRKPHKVSAPFKETVSRDFRPPVFFINRWPLGPW
jgi:hypothetical protein